MSNQIILGIRTLLLHRLREQGLAGPKPVIPTIYYKESDTFPRSLWLFDLRAVTGLEAKLIRAIDHSETPTLSS